MFYILVFHPALRRSPQSPRVFIGLAASEFRVVVNTCIIVLVVTGVILAFDRLTIGTLAVSYVATLAVKIGLSIWMVILVREQRRSSEALDSYLERQRPGSRRIGGIARFVSGYHAVTVLGLIVFFLSDILKIIFEVMLGSG